MQGDSGFQIPSEYSLELYLSQTEVWQKMRNYIKQPQVKK